MKSCKRTGLPGGTRVSSRQGDTIDIRRQRALADVGDAVPPSCAGRSADCRPLRGFQKRRMLLFGNIPADSKNASWPNLT